jgi:preprotein translocase subunit SecE
MALEQDNSTSPASGDNTPGKPVDMSRKAPGSYPQPKQRPANMPAPAVVSIAPEGSFFSIYKKGQGYWTRMGTALAGLLIGILATAFLFDQLRNADMIRGKALIISGIFMAVYALFVVWIANKPRNDDFLIATDSEMKKVNWTSKKDLIGSTKVVIIFMFLIATLLFVIDIEFGQDFYYARVLAAPPISWSVNVNHLTAGSVAGVDIVHPETKAVLVSARQPIGSALSLVKSSGLSSVSIVPSLFMWSVSHVVVILLLGYPLLRRLKQERRPA